MRRAEPIRKYLVGLIWEKLGNPLKIMGVGLN